MKHLIYLILLIIFSINSAAQSTASRLVSTQARPVAQSNNPLMVWLDTTGGIVNNFIRTTSFDAVIVKQASVSGLQDSLNVKAYTSQLVNYLQKADSGNKYITPSGLNISLLPYLLSSTAIPCILKWNQFAYYCHWNINMKRKIFYIIVIIFLAGNVAAKSYMVGSELNAHLKIEEWNTVLKGLHTAPIPYDESYPVIEKLSYQLLPQIQDTSQIKK